MLKHLILGVLFNLFVTSIDAGVPAEMAELAQQLHNECVGQTGADESVMATVNNKQGFPDDAKLKCYIKCLMTELAVIDDDGEVDIEAFVGLMPDDMKETSEKTFKACGTKKGADICDTVYLTHKCYYETDPASVSASHSITGFTHSLSNIRKIAPVYPLKSSRIHYYIFLENKEIKTLRVYRCTS